MVLNICLIYLIIFKRSKPMKKILIDVQRSLDINPPKYGKGIIHLKRDKINLRSLIVVDDAGNSLQPRPKDLEEQELNELETSYKANGVLYDKEVMVVEQRRDGKLELQSGYNRLYVLLTKLGITTYFADVIEYENPFYKALWKRRFNASKDHTAKGTPNTIGAYLLGLTEAKSKSSFKWKDDNEVLDALEFMANGSKTPDQLKKILKKWRQTNDPNPNVRGLNSEMANALSDAIGIPHKGYCKDLTDPLYGRIGYNTYGGGFDAKIKAWVDLHDKWEVPIEVYGFVQYVVEDRIAEQREADVVAFNTTTEWMRTHLDSKYHDIVHFKGWHAQIRTPNPDDGGKPLERGIVDKNGKILIDKDPILTDIDPKGLIFL